MEAAILILALLFVAFVALGVYVSMKAIGAAKRGVERTVTQARRTVEETTLRAKSFGQGGVAGELAQLRLSLRTSMRATQDALHAGAAEDASLSESLALFRRLSAHGHELDDELKRLEREPDRATVASLLPGLRERTERISRSAESLRWAARDRARKFADDDLDALSLQIDVEAGALRHWSGEGVPGADMRDVPDVPDTAPEPASWPEAGRTAGAGGAAGHGVASEQTWPEPGARSEPGPGHTVAEQPQAITARDPRQQTSYPWQKNTRPETTN
ncbi:MULTISPECIES: hypothetical protein [unclassified Streptomyces]|uniref:hypothetical protein n=1 Tax=unclassified Streptomyces TaxID=2593676 RepID=UPI002DDA454C|nr:hypothetical protein [Streptomyces sp. NBC_01750]WSB02858.1 hypothetical protein OIE54_28455 [Streptomyces sp. NBC_01794]WSD32870.1 hypothetical protein OG966_13670 [Streptomyces sp. NBC_01750]